MKISHLLFDIDNTLYSGEAPINKNITRRMILFAENFLNVSYDEAIRLRKEKLPVYGSTLNWLRKEYNFTDTEFFFNTVHPAEEEKELIPDPDLRQFLQSLNLPMTILTNAPGIHAMRVLNFYGIADLFESIHDIETCGLTGKPYESAFRAALDKFGHKLDETLFMDDSTGYVKGFSSIGGKAVLVTDELKLPESAYGVEDGIFAKIRSVYDMPLLLEKCKSL